MLTPKLNEREVAHITAALRYWGRATEVARDKDAPVVEPRHHMIVQRRIEGHPPMGLDEIETLIARLDGLQANRKLRPWDPLKEVR